MYIGTICHNKKIEQLDTFANHILSPNYYHHCDGLIDIVKRQVSMRA